MSLRLIIHVIAAVAGLIFSARFIEASSGLPGEVLDNLPQPNAFLARFWPAEALDDELTPEGRRLKRRTWASFGWFVLAVLVFVVSS